MSDEAYYLACIQQGTLMPKGVRKPRRRKPKPPAPGETLWSEPDPPRVPYVGKTYDPSTADNLVAVAGSPCTLRQVRTTIQILDYYRQFLASPCEKCRDLEDRHFHGTINRVQVRRRLTFLIHAAINRKSGIPDVACRKQDAEYQATMRRECGEIRDWINHRRRPLGRRFQTPEFQRRYGHILSDEN